MSFEKDALNDHKEEAELDVSLKPDEKSMASAEDELKAEKEQLKDQLLRTLAEAENLRKRTHREKEETRQYAITNFAREILSVADNLTRALTTLSTVTDMQAADLKSLQEGIELTQKELEAIFNRQGIKKVVPLGEKFDHNFHQAMFETETDDVIPGTVTQVLQEGYVIHERLLRPAMVGVAKIKSTPSLS